MNAPVEAAASIPAADYSARRWRPKAQRPLLPTFLDDDRPLPRWALPLTGVVITIAYLLLWSPYWYPLADSGLYLSLGRSMADGDGFRYMGLPYKRITPLTPALIAMVFKLGGTVAAVHAVMIALLLVSNLFCFLTLRNWFNARIALLATIVAAAQFWIWRNGIFIMTEPAFLAGFWVGMYCLSLVPRTVDTAKQWKWVILGLLGLVFAYESRAIPTLILCALALAALCLTTRKSVTGRHRLDWVLIYVAVFGFLLYEFGKPAEGAEEVEQFVKVDTARGERTKAVKGLSERYNVKVFSNVKGRWWEKALYAPVLAGRWINEGFVSPAVVFFGSRSRAFFAAGCVFALASVTFCLIGWLTVLRRGHWWAALLPLYAGPFFMNWFGRVLPRYYVPIAPLLFILLCVGMTATIAWALRRWREPRQPSATVSWLPRVPAAIATLIVLGNIPVYAVEYYVRNLGQRDFYDYARQGALRELIDLGGYLQNHADPQAIVYINKGGFGQRVGFFLAGRRIEMPVDTRTAQLEVKDSNNPAQVQHFLNKVPPEARHAIVFLTEHDWPDWHWPLNPPKDAPARSWWQLYERNPATGQFQRVNLPEARDYLLKSVPPSGLKGVRLEQTPTTQPTTAPSSIASRR